jgi:tetratricopeptide (TPR) repeat protein
MGLADLAMYEGKYEDALAILEPALAKDVKDANTQGVTTKSLAIAEANAALGRRAPAQAAVKRVLDGGAQEDVLLPASRVLAAIGREADATALAATLGAQVPVRTRAYGKIIEGELALKAGHPRDAYDAFEAARKLSDVWLTHFNLGIALAGVERYVEAITEFDLAHKRRGEATALFLDDVPTCRMLVPLPYWQGRASEGAKLASAARDYYRAYLALRGSSAGDPLAADATRRLQPGS